MSDEPSRLESWNLLAFMKVRNELLRLPYNLDYHRGLGIDHFFIVDNDSTDGTREWLASQLDVTHFHSDLLLHESDAGAAWFNALLDEFGIGKWSLVLDADELFVFPNCEAIRLADYADRLDSEGVVAVFAIMLDMYAKRPISKVRYKPGRPFLDFCPYFDGDGYKFTAFDYKGLTPKYLVRGGVRERLFYKRGKSLAPVLNKLPMVKWKPGMTFKSGNHCLVPEVPLSSSWGAILHFKFFSDFFDRVAEEVSRGVMFKFAEEYKMYERNLRNNLGLTPYGDQSMKYRGSKQLVDLGLMRECTSRT